MIETKLKSQGISRKMAIFYNDYLFYYLLYLLLKTMSTFTYKNIFPYYSLLLFINQDNFICKSIGPLACTFL